MQNLEFETLRKLIDEELKCAVPAILKEDNLIGEAMNYGLTTGGKRIRGVLTVAFCDRMCVPRAQSLPFAVALEMIHAYSLVHDDMPEMDNDDFRRGMPSCHKKYGPAIALLAGDGILIGAVEYLLSRKDYYKSGPFLNAMSILLRSSGASGMLGGQVLDMQAEQRKISLEELCELHRMKTGALLLAPAEIAGALAEENSLDYCAYCKHIGLAFQIKDDLLDVEGNAEVLGKAVGKDQEENKSTFVSLLGASKAKEYLKKEIDGAVSYAKDDTFLLWLANYIATREK